MFLKSFTHTVPTIDQGDHFAIEGLTRSCNYNSKYISMHKGFLSDLSPSGKTALIYCAPIPLANAETDGLEINKLVHVHSHRYACALKNTNVSYIEIEGSACAGSLAGIVKAFKLMNYEDFSDVILITDERISCETVQLFVDMRIDIKPGDGFCAMHLTKNNPQLETAVEFSDLAIGFYYNNNPFLTSKQGYQSVIKTKNYEYVKVHGTGTDVNDEAEEEFCRGKKIIKYKDKYGHMQGASGAVEICQMLTEYDELPRTLCLASGLGNFYAGLIVKKTTA